MVDATLAPPTPASWQAASAWAGVLPAAGRSGKPDGIAGVTLRPLDHRPMATIIARRDATDAFAAFCDGEWGFRPPASGRGGFGARGDLLWSAPHQWLAVDGPAADTAALAHRLAGMAAVSAQGDGRALVEIGGPHARDALAKCVGIDLHPDVFAPGRVAVTAFAHLSVQLWQRPGSTALTLCAPRTVAGSVWRTLVGAAAEYGLDVIA